MLNLLEWLHVKGFFCRLSECAMRSLLLVCCSPLPFLVAAVPRFDPSALLNNVLVPADASVGSVIYRLRASDPTYDYPLTFTIKGDYTAVSVESLNCTRFNSVCQANVIVRKKLEPSRYYDFTVNVESVNGASASINCSFRATNATTPWGEIFPGAPTLFTVSEKARRNTDLGSVIARGNPVLPDPVYLELWGSPQFALHQRLINLRDAEGTIVLLSQLDYEVKTVHHLTVLSNNPFTDVRTDTRNIAGWPLLVVVLDEQDTPPVFTLAPPTTVLNPSLTPGDLILQVKAEDGDRGKPRDIRYGLVSDGSPFYNFFEIDEQTGELRLARPLSEIIAASHMNQPILLTVVAEEVRGDAEEPPAQSTTVRLALIPPGVTAGSPTFGSSEYNAFLDENAPSGTFLKLPQANIRTQPGDVVTLELINNNGTFDITPSVVEGQSEFQISVHDPKLLDYEERKSVICEIVAKEIGTGNFTAKAKLTVLLNDVNDNAPEFLQEVFIGSVPENAVAGTTILLVEAADIDSEPGNKIRYTSLTGPGSHLFKLEPETGVITLAASDSLDAETTAAFELTVGATDEDGNGKSSFAKIIVNLIDINDESPVFEKDIYEFIVNPDKTGFTSDAVIKAIDKDITSPNNEVRYEIVNPIDGLVLNDVLGEFGLTKTWRPTEMVTLKARAWDGGIPRLSGLCEVRIYPPETNSRMMTFIVPGRDPDTEVIADILRTITGAKVTINDVRPYRGYEPDATDISKDTDTERSVVVTTVNYSKGSIIDVKKIQDILDQEYRVRRGEMEVKEAGGGSMLWLLLLLLFLLILLALILLCCCLWDKCPCYASLNRRRKVRSAEAIKIITTSPGQGHESKSVQVAEWFGRREAWTPEPATLEVESLKRHEMERGSDRSRVQFQKTQQANEYYVREGNADILRLYTSRENAPHHRSVALAPENTYLPDSGKDILMRRFMDQQQHDNQKQEMLLPNAAVIRLQSEHEALEASLREQNAMLKQILQERERELKLETQSLPAGTQTDQDAGTQTDPHLFLPPRREVQSNDEQSDGSDEDLVIIREKAKRRNGYRTTRIRTKRRIRTPIQEESEVDFLDDPDDLEEHYVAKNSRVRSTKAKEMGQERHRDGRTQSGIRRDVLKEISDSLRHEREMYANDIRDQILLDITSTLQRRNRSSSETRNSTSGFRRDILQDISNAIGRRGRTTSETQLNRNDPQEYLIREIADSILDQHQLEKQETLSSGSPVRSKTKQEIMEEIVDSLNRSNIDTRRKASSEKPSRATSESRISKSGLRREILEEIASSMAKSKNITSASRVSKKKGRTRSESRSTRSGLKREVLQEIVSSFNESPKNDKAKEEQLVQQMSRNLKARSAKNVSEDELKREILQGLSAVVDRNDISPSDEEYTDDSLDNVSPNSESLSKEKYHSEIDLRDSQDKPKNQLSKSRSQTDLNRINKKTKVESKQQTEVKAGKEEVKNTKQPKRQSRYMEWYSKNNKPKEKTKKKMTEQIESDPSTEQISKELEKQKVEAKISQRLLKDTESSARKKQMKKKAPLGPEHPLLQHSEHRFEVQYPRRAEDDADSGIAMTRPAIAQKKSVFTIAYNDMHTSQIHDNPTATPP
ncbi:cadherin-86C-like [Coccinella septempunctata]|uniref:cadherin-86C-like n=1 Tax=Coccinella septempunctata TaxID=41139 RepID=UPI001D060EFF|nr:cadherin-86C-like [Coccinella septempunctata]